MINIDVKKRLKNPVKIRSYDVIIKALVEFSKEYNVTFGEIDFIGTWIGGTYVMPQYGKFLHEDRIK